MLKKILIFINKIAAALLLVFAATVVQAGTYGEWNSSPIGGGGYLLSTIICPSNPDIIYCNSDVGGLFRSSNGGKSWKMIHGTTSTPLYNVRSINVDPRNADIILAAVGSQYIPKRGIFRSTDGGKSWVQACKALFIGNGNLRACGQSLARDPKQPDIIYAASPVDGILVSKDNGKSWKSLNAMKGYGVADLKIDTGNPSRLWLCTKKYGIRPREANGKITLKDGFFRSDDAGKTWTKLGDKSPIEMLQAPWDSSLLYGIFDRRSISMSTDGGKTWTEINNGLKIAKAGKKVKPIYDTYYLALAGGPDFILTGSGKGSFYRLDRGSKIWKKIPCKFHQGNWFLKTLPKKWSHFGRATSSISIDPKNPKRWFFTDYYAVYQTKDAGRNWQLCIDGIEMIVIHTLVTDPSNSNRVLLGMADNAPIISNDSGNSFKQKTNGVGNTKCIAIAMSNPKIAYSTGPKNWSWTANALRISNDGGIHWKWTPSKGLGNMKSGAICTVAVSPISPSEVYVARSGPTASNKGGVYRSTDNGKTFTWDSTGFGNEKSFFRPSIWHSGRELAIGSDGNNMVAIGQGKKNVYYRTKGEEWKASGNPPSGRHYDLTADPHTPARFYLASAGSGLFRSDDGGATWKQIIKGDVVSVACDPFNTGRIAVAMNREGKVCYSQDNGDSWKELDKSLPNRHGLKLCFSGDRLLAGSDGNGVFYIELPDEK